MVALRISDYRFAMASRNLDEYLAQVPEPQRSALQCVRERIHAAYPDVEELFAYGVPAFSINGITVAGVAARKNGCSYYPMSGAVLDSLDLGALGYTRTKGALRFPSDAPLSLALIRKLLEARLALG